MLGALLPEAPAHRVDDVGFSTAVGANDSGHVVVEHDDLAIGEGLEPHDLDLLDAHGEMAAPCRVVAGHTNTG